MDLDEEKNKEITASTHLEDYLAISSKLESLRVTFLARVAGILISHHLSAIKSQLFTGFGESVSETGAVVAALAWLGRSDLESPGCSSAEQVRGASSAPYRGGSQVTLSRSGPRTPGCALFYLVSILIPFYLLVPLPQTSTDYHERPLTLFACVTQ